MGERFYTVLLHAQKYTYSLSAIMSSTLEKHLDEFSTERRFTNLTSVKNLFFVYFPIEDNDDEDHQEQTNTRPLIPRLTDELHAAVRKGVVSITSTYRVFGATILCVELPTRIKYRPSDLEMYTIVGYKRPRLRSMKFGHTIPHTHEILRALEQKHTTESPRLTLDLRRSRTTSSQENRTLDTPPPASMQPLQSETGVLAAYPISTYDPSVTATNPPPPPCGRLLSPPVQVPPHPDMFPTVPAPGMIGDWQHEIHHHQMQEERHRIQDLEFWNEHIRIELQLAKEAQDIKQRQYAHWRKGEIYRTSQLGPPQSPPWKSV